MSNSDRVFIGRGLSDREKWGWISMGISAVFALASYEFIWQFRLAFLLVSLLALQRGIRLLRGEP